jgi:transcriptional regulator with XRE-family HTH domain
MAEVAGIGERIAAYRLRRGLSQATLAGLVGRSESWLSQVERGIRSVDRLSVLLDMARVLHVDVESLVGRPWQYAPNGGPTADGLDEIRQVFTSYSRLLGGAAPELPPAAELMARVDTTHGHYQAARYQDVIGLLPDLLSTVDAIPRVTGADRPELLRVYVSAYIAAAKLLTKLGVTDLAAVAADRAATVATETESLADRGLAAYQIVCALLRADRTDEAERLAVGMAEEMHRSIAAPTPAVLSAEGALWLIAGVTAARRADQHEAAARLDIADEVAARLGHDGNHGWTAFGPTNVAIHRVSVAAELGDAGEALRSAALVDAGRLSEGLRSRRAQVYLDLAWAQAQRKRDAEAVLLLLEAERSAPETIRYNLIVRETIREMVHRSRGPATSTLHELAERAGALG